MTALSVRRLDGNDGAILTYLARHEDAFDIAGRSEPGAPLADADARAFLDDANVLFWIAELNQQPIGFLSCQLIRRRADKPELLLYEIGVHASQRRHGIGRALMQAMDDWMRAHSIDEVWVLADNDGAVAFYAACGFAVDEGPAVYMTRESGGAAATEPYTSS